jgi:VCBS repeat-containing protein
VLANDTDADGGSLTAAIVANPTKGTLNLNPDGSFTYTPNLNANGSDSFTYKASDGLNSSDITTVNIDITAVNDLPTAPNYSFTVTEGETFRGSLPGGDPDGPVVRWGVATDATKGLVHLNGTDPGFEYKAVPGRTGTDQFTYSVYNTTGGLNTATGTVTITIVPNQPPVANADAYSTDEDTPLTVGGPGVLANDTNDSAGLRAAVVTQPTKGTLSLNPDGSFTYTPDPDANGPDSFTYAASDNLATGTTATVSITVTPVNDAPATTSWGIDPSPNKVYRDTLTSHASDVEDDALTYALVSYDPSYGTLVVNPDGTYVWDRNGKTGLTDFRWSVTDGQSAPVENYVSVMAF